MDEFDRLIDLLSRVFPNGPGDLGSIPGHIILKALKMVLDTSLLNSQQYKVSIEGKLEQTHGKGVAPSSTPRCSSYRKGSLLVTLDNDRQLYFTSNVLQVFFLRIGKSKVPIDFLLILKMCNDSTHSRYCISFVGE